MGSSAEHAHVYQWLNGPVSLTNWIRLLPSPKPLHWAGHVFHYECQSPAPGRGITFRSSCHGDCVKACLSRLAIACMGSWSGFSFGGWLRGHSPSSSGLRLTRPNARTNLRFPSVREPIQASCELDASLTVVSRASIGAHDAISHRCMLASLSRIPSACYMLLFVRMLFYGQALCFILVDDAGTRTPLMSYLPSPPCGARCGQGNTSGRSWMTVAPSRVAPWSTWSASFGIAS